MNIGDTLRRITIQQPSSFGGLTVYPLSGNAAVGDHPGYTTLDEALAAGTARVTEIDEGGSVPELAFFNEGDRPVLVLDGEELAGAKQNRIVNLTLLVPANTKIVIPVSCVEAGRWNSMSAEFRSTPQVVYSRARSRKYADVSFAMSSGAGRCSDQGAVWEDIEQKQRELLSDSPTARMTDTFEQNRNRLDDYVRELPCVAGQTGAAFALADRVSCVELFDCDETLEKMWPKLIRSWALDALVLRGEPGEAPTVSAAQALLDEIAAAPVSEHEALGLGSDIRFDGSQLNGGALVCDERLLHLCVFRNGSNGNNGGLPVGGMVRASRRRSRE